MNLNELIIYKGFHVRVANLDLSDLVCQPSKHLKLIIRLVVVS